MSELQETDSLSSYSMSLSTMSSQSGDREYGCPVETCTECVSSKMGLMHHWNREHQAARREFLCPLYRDGCFYHNTHTANIKRHFASKHRDRAPTKEMAAKLCARGLLYAGDFTNPDFTAPGSATPPMTPETYYVKAGLNRLAQFDLTPFVTQAKDIIVTVPNQQPITVTSSAVQDIPSEMGLLEEAIGLSVGMDFSDTLPGDAQGATCQENVGTGVNDFLMVDPSDLTPLASIKPVEPEESLPEKVPTPAEAPKVAKPCQVRPFCTAAQAWNQVQMWMAIYRLCLAAETEQKQPSEGSQGSANSRVHQLRLEAALRQLREENLQLRARLCQGNLDAQQ